MANLRRWSRLIAPSLAPLPAALVVGCGGAPTLVEVARPPEPSASASASAGPLPRPPVDLSDPPDAKLGIGELVTSAREPSRRAATYPADVTPYGGGVMALSSFVDGGRCAVHARAGACMFARFGKWKGGARAEGHAFLRPAVDDEVIDWSPPVPWPGGWDAYLGVTDGLLGVRFADGVFVDRIDEVGGSTPVLALPGAPQPIDARLVETADGFALVGTVVDEGAMSEQLVALGIRRGADGYALHHYTKLKISPAPDGAAASARVLRAMGRRVSWGATAVSPVLDEDGALTKDWALVWTEVQPPAKFTPTGMAPGIRGGKNGCGRSSRPLTDPSVTKQTHVMIFGSGGRQRADHVVAVDLPPDEAPTHAISPRADGFDIDGRAFDRRLLPSKERPSRRAGDAPIVPPAIEARESQALLAAGYHQTDGEGLVLFTEGGGQYAQRFSARGAPVGPVLEIQFKVPTRSAPSPSLEKAGDSWVMLDGAGDSLLVLVGPSAGRQIAVPSARSWVLPPGPTWLLPLDEHRVELVRSTRLPKSYLTELDIPDGGGAALMSSVVDVERGVASPWALWPGWYGGESLSARLATVTTVVRASDGGALIVGSASDRVPMTIHRLANGDWSAPVTLGEDGGSHATVLGTPRVFGDTVVLLGGSGVVGTWLERSSTIPIGERPGPNGTGPILPRLDLALGGEPGAPFRLPKEIKSLIGDCPRQFASGPRRAVMVCVEAVDAQVPGRRVGWRTVRY